MYYSDEDMLMLSGIQHYMFCPRQWALIHIEQQWEDNKLTAEGELMHKQVDNPFYRQRNGSKITLRSVPIASKVLGLYGVSDAVELHPTDDVENAMTHQAYSGLWLPYPIEYKRGREKLDERDEVQLAAQVICLEEMYQVHIREAALYYGETRSRKIVPITEPLRELVHRLSTEMHDIYKRGITPLAVKKSHCKSCSLVDLCLPQLKYRTTVSEYLKSKLLD